MRAIALVTLLSSWVLMYCPNWALKCLFQSSPIFHDSFTGGILLGNALVGNFNCCCWSTSGERSDHLMTRFLSSDAGVTVLHVSPSCMYVSTVVLTAGESRTHRALVRGHDHNYLVPVAFQRTNARTDQPLRPEGAKTPTCQGTVGR